MKAFLHLYIPYKKVVLSCFLTHEIRSGFYPAFLTKLPFITPCRVIIGCNSSRSVMQTIAFLAFKV